MEKTFTTLGRGFQKLAKLIFRTIAFLVLLAALALATAALVVQNLVSEEDLKSILTAQLQDVFHRPVQIQNVKFSVYQGIRVQGFQVLESPAFGGGNLMASDYLLAKYKWKALLRKRLEFEQIQVVAPRIQLLRRQDGHWNWEDILTSSATRHSHLDILRLSLPVDLFAHVISIEHGTLTVKDLRKGREYAFQGMELALQDFDPEKPFSVNASFENSHTFSNQRVYSRISLRGSVSLAGLHLDQAAFQADKMEVRSGGKTLRASLVLKDFQHPRIWVDVRLPRLDANFLSQYRPVPKDLSIPTSRWRARFSFPEENRLQLDSLTVLAAPIKLQASGSLGLSKGARGFRVAWVVPPVSLDEATAVWEWLGKYNLSGRLSGSGEVVGDLEDLDHTLAVEKVGLDLQDFGGDFPKNRRIAHADAHVAGGRNLENLSVVVDRGSLTAYGSVFSGLDISANIHKGDLEFQHLNGTWDISHFKLRGRIQRLLAPREIRVEGAIDKMRLDAAIEAFERLLDQIRASHPRPPSRAQRLWSQVFKYSIPKSFPATSGVVTVGQVTYPHFQTANLEVRWDLRGISTGLRQANGNVRIGFGPGHVADIPALEDQDPHNILRVIFLPFVFMHRLNNLTVISAATAYPKSMDVNRIYGDYGLQRGVVTVRLFQVDSNELLASAEGQVDFPREKVDLHILTRLTHSRGPLPEYLTDEQGRPSIGFYVEDNLNRPTLKIEYRKMESDAIEKALKAGFERGRRIFSRIKEAL